MKQYKESGKDVDFEVNWLPFQLDANAPIEGVNKMEMYEKKFGKERIAQMLPSMKKVIMCVCERESVCV